VPRNLSGKTVRITASFPLGDLKTVSKPAEVKLGGE